MKKKLLMLALHMAASSTDAYLTNRNQHLRYHSEADPVARTFVSHGQPLLITYFATAFTVEEVAQWELHKHGYKKAAMGVAVFNILDHAAGAGMSAHGYKPGGVNGN